MTEWDSRLQDAAIWGRLEQWEDSLEDAAEVAEDQGDEAALIAMERIKSVRRFVEHQLSNADAFLISNKSLETLAAQATKVREAVEQYVSSGDRSHLVPSGGQNAAYHGDRMVVVAKQIPGAGPEASLETIRDTVRSVRATATQNLRRLEEDVEESQEKMNEIRSLAETRIEELQQEAAEAQEKIQGDAEQRLSTLDEKIDSQKQRISDALGRFESSFETAESKRQEQFEEDLKKWTDDFDETFSDYRSKADEFVADMKEDRDEVKKLMGLIGTSGRARGFEERADYQDIVSYIWRGLTVLAMLGLVAAGWWLADEAVSTEAIEWHAFLGKLTLLGTIGVLAGYAARQGREHFSRARLNRQLQLELTSIKPYLADFPPNEERQLLKLFALRWFGNLPSESDSEEGQPIRDEVQRMARDIIHRGDVGDQG